MEKLSKAMPWGSITKLAKEFNLYDAQIRRILDGKVVGHPEVLEAAEREIRAAKADKAAYEADRRRLLKLANR